MLISLLFAFEKSAQINYFVYLKNPNTSLRKGPNVKNGIAYILTTPRYPLRVIASYDHWRQVADFNGPLGWAHKTAFIVASDKRRFGVVTKPCTLIQKDTNKELANLPEGFIVQLQRKEGKMWFVLVKDPTRKDKCILSGFVPCHSIWGE